MKPITTPSAATTHAPHTHQTHHPVIVIGAGPTGLMLAAELALAKIDVVILERRTELVLEGARAGGLQSRTLELLDQRGVVDRFLRRGQTAQVGGFGMVPLSIADFPTPHPYGLALWQSHIEELLAEWVRQLGVEIQLGQEVQSLVQDEHSVTLQLANNTQRRADYVVGCDGGRSVVRKAVGIPFTGWEATTSNLIAEVEMAETPPLGIHRTEHGIHSFGRLNYDIVDGKVIFRDEGPIRVMLPEPVPERNTKPSLEELRAALLKVCGTEYGLSAATALSRFNDAALQAGCYRSARVLLAGDAAHIHSPVGGQGLNLGMQDAVNLGWKLAQVVKGISPPTLLDTYHDERHPVGARVLRNALAQIALLRTDKRSTALRDVFSQLLALDEPRKILAGMMAALDVRYDFGDAHPLLGRRMPDIPLATAQGTVTAYSLMHRAEHLLINFTPELHYALGPWQSRVRALDACYSDKWQLPVLGEVANPKAVLVRPDGHVAWVAAADDHSLESALQRWCGGV